MGSRIGTLKISAKRIGISFEEYMKRISEGLKYCWKCKTWKIIEQFGIDKGRHDGHHALCQMCRRPRTGLPKFPTEQSLDKQARWAINHAVAAGRLAKASTLPCFDCGKAAKEYDHYKGYKKEHWFTIHAVCSSCHKKRTYSRYVRIGPNY
jgi:hypothetical protein